MVGHATWGWVGNAPIPPAKACDWMFDLREDDHLTPEHAKLVKFKPGDGRKILSRSNTEVVVEDRVGGGEPFQATLTREGPTTLHVRSAGRGRTMDAVYEFESDNGGCRIETKVNVTAGGFFGILLPLFRGKLERTHRQDMDIHLDYMVREWKATPW